MRPNPSSPSSIVNRKTDAELGLVTQTRTYQLITPLFGGGVEAGRNDFDLPVNGKSIRGQLRFWWRAIRGYNQNIQHYLDADLGQIQNQTKRQVRERQITAMSEIDKLRWLEGLIWGMAAGDDRQPSKIQLHVEILQTGHEIDYNSNSNNVKYGAFPLQTAQHKTILEGVQFKLLLSCPQHYWTEVEAALWAWEHFGGIGARTRRGFGAVHCQEIDGIEQQQTQTQVRESMAKRLSELSQKTWCRDLPHLSAEPTRSVLTNQTWDAMLGKLKAFRQSRASGNPAGRSYWTEPDAVRALYKQGKWTSSEKHKHPSLWNDPQIIAFPRAAFGLPILFHFRTDNDNKGEPRDTSLQGYSHDRLASRLIFRPIRCKEGDKCVAIILDAPITPPRGLILKNAGGSPQVRHQVTSAEASRIEPLKTRTVDQGETDVLKAFLQSL